MVELSELKQSPFLADVVESDIQQLARIASIVNFREGEILFQANSPARYLYILKSGCVLLCFPNGRSLVVGQSGQALGWSSLVSPLHYTATGICLTDSVFFQFTNAELFDLFRMDTTLATTIMAKIEVVIQERKPYRTPMAA
ncbi:MAG: cyclic nucleotide-binding domain-containing protein [Desulfosoma sp.]